MLMVLISPGEPVDDCRSSVIEGLCESWSNQQRKELAPRESGHRNILLQIVWYESMDGVTQSVYVVPLAYCTSVVAAHLGKNTHIGNNLSNLQLSGGSCCASRYTNVACHDVDLNGVSMA